MDLQLIEDLIDAADSLMDGRAQVKELQDSANQRLALAKLRVRLATHHYRRIAVRGDGNCYFRAVSYAFFHTEAYHMFFREASVATMRKNPQLYMRRWDTQHTYESYLLECATFGKPASRHFILACVDTFKMKVVVLHASGSDAVEELIPRSGDIYFVIYMSHIPQHADALIPTAEAHPYAIVNPEVLPKIMALMSRYTQYEDDSSDEADYIW